MAAMPVEQTSYHNHSRAAMQTSPPTSKQIPSASNLSPRSSAQNHVQFNDREADKVRKTKYLTAKYGAHQMMLIRKRLAVEDWVYDELRRLYNCVEDADDHNCDLELEYLLDCDEESERRQYIQEKLADAKQPKEEIQKFTEEVLRKARTL